MTTWACSEDHHHGTARAVRHTAANGGKGVARAWRRAPGLTRAAGRANAISVAAICAATQMPAQPPRQRYKKILFVALRAVSAGQQRGQRVVRVSGRGRGGRPADGGGRWVVGGGASVPSPTDSVCDLEIMAHMAPMRNTSDDICSSQVASRKRGVKHGAVCALHTQARLTPMTMHCRHPDRLQQASGSGEEWDEGEGRSICVRLHAPCACGWLGARHGARRAGQGRRRARTRHKLARPEHEARKTLLVVVAADPRLRVRTVLRPVGVCECVDEGGSRTCGRPLPPR